MELIIYLFKVGGLFGVFYSIYFLLFRKSTHFQINRLYLLLIVPAAFILPIINSTVEVNSQFQITLPTIVLSNIKAGIATFNWTSFLEITYACVSSIFLISILKKLYKLRRTISLIKEEKITAILPFSFFQFIHIPKDVAPENREAIFLHEKVHSSQNHSIDILLYQLITIILWWNPFIWIASKSVQNNHEYIADKLASEKTNEYSSVLVAQLLGVNCSELANNFNYEPLIKKRMKMMKSKKSNNFSILKYALVIPVVTLSIVATSNPSLINNYVPVEIQEGDKVYDVVEKMPEFKGGTTKMMSYLGGQIKYPIEAKEKGAQGTSYIEFVVTKKGEIKNVTVKKSADPLLDIEAIRVIKSMPNWTPGEDKGKKVDVKLVLPIKFQF